MNRTLKATAAIMLMMVFALGCTKPDEPNNGGNNSGQNDTIVEPNNGGENDSIIDNSGTLNGHDYVDLGLPSGTLWATCNVGAEVPEDYGDYYAWGETEPKTTYDWSTYKYCEGDYDLLTKYCSESRYGYNGFTDDLYDLQPSDDAATVNWGEGWRMPDGAEGLELLNNCDHRWDSINGVSGLLVIGNNGNTLFLPAAGLKGVFSYDGESQIDFNQAGHSGQYWMRERGIAFSNYSTPDVEYMANEFYFPYGNNGGSRTERSRGLPIRPVRSAK